MPLSNTSLVVRYYFDEAVSGTAPASVIDRSANGYHLDEVNYGSGNMAYTEVSGNRGLESTDSGGSGTQRARHAIHDSADAVRSALTGSKTITLEIVATIDALNSVNNSFIFGIQNRSSAFPTVGLSSNTASSLSAFWETAEMRGSIPWTAGVRYVWHVVFDTAQATANDRVKVYRDGVLQSPSVIANPALDDTFTMAASLDLSALNRENAGSFGRSFDGIVYYAAIYARAFAQGDVTAHYDILTLGDDFLAGAVSWPLGMSNFPHQLEDEDEGHFSELDARSWW